MGHTCIKFPFNSKFDFTAKSLVTNTVVITRVLCTINMKVWVGELGFNVPPTTRLDEDWTSVESLIRKTGEAGDGCGFVV